MIYQPRNVQPSYISIDATENNTFTMEINSNNYVNGYELTILNWDNTVAYQGDKTTIATPIYNGETLAIPVPSSIGLINGYNYKWYVKLYQPTADMLITYGIVQQDSENTITVITQPNINIKAGMKITINGETKEIASYTYNNEIGTATLTTDLSKKAKKGDTYQIYSDFIQTIPEYILYVRKTPIVTITNYTPSLDKKYKTFEGSYVQNNNVPLVYHKWDLYLVNDNGSTTLLKTSGKVYNADIKFYYDGFKNSQTYQINLTVETQYGVVATSGSQTFTVSYTAIEYLQQPVATVLNDKDAIQVDWVAPVNFPPLTINTLVASGYIQPGEITNHSLYLEPGQTINPGATFSTDILTKAFVYSYDAQTGYTTFLNGGIVGVHVGDYYTISDYVESMEGITILRDTPYIRSNSAKLGTSILEYRNPNEVEPMGVFPEKYNITMQFRPDMDFFYGTNGIYNDLISITSFVVDKEPNDNAGTISIFAHRYNIIALKSELDSAGDIVTKTFPAPPEGKQNTSTQIYLADNIDLTKQPYLLLNKGDYIEYITAFDSATKMATLGRDLPNELIPVAGDTYVMQDTLSVPFYSNINNTFCLQNNAVSIASNDYVWIDEGYVWNDSQYWVEGGTEVARISENWWKLQITNSTIRIEKGGL